MTTTTRNEAAERLLLFVEDELQPQFKSSAGYRDWQEAARRFFDTTLGAERRATVERIRERMEAEYTVLYGRGVCLSLLSEVLDEEAQRA